MTFPDFLELALKPMEEGACDDDNALHVSSDDPFVNIPVKKLCGTVNKVEKGEMQFLPFFLHILTI